MVFLSIKFSKVCNFFFPGKSCCSYYIASKQRLAIRIGRESKSSRGPSQEGDTVERPSGQDMHAGLKKATGYQSGPASSIHSGKNLNIVGVTVVFGSVGKKGMYLN